MPKYKNLNVVNNYPYLNEMMHWSSKTRLVSVSPYLRECVFSVSYLYSPLRELRSAGEPVSGVNIRIVCFLKNSFQLLQLGHCERGPYPSVTGPTSCTIRNVFNKIATKLLNGLNR